MRNATLPPMPDASFTTDAVVSRSTAEVWDRLQDAQTWSNIGPVEEVWDAEHDADGHLTRYRWSTTVGPRKYRGRADVVEADPGRMMALDLDAVEVAGRLTTVLSENGDGSTHLEVTLLVEAKGMLSTMFFPVVSDAVGRGLP